MVYLTPKAIEQATNKCLLPFIQPLSGGQKDLNPLLELIADAPCVLLGLSSFGSAELYQLRIELTQRLIQEQHFNLLALVADWPNSARVNAYLQGQGTDGCAPVALEGFRAFPHWLWRNAPTVAFLEWLKAWNTQRETAAKTQLIGLDLFGILRAAKTVLAFWGNQDNKIAKRVQGAYARVLSCGNDLQAYGHLSRQAAVAHSARHLRAEYERLLDYSHGLPAHCLSEWQACQQALACARVVMNAETYLRLWPYSRVAAWNRRQQHMFHTLQSCAAAGHYRLLGGPKMIVWGHSCALGDARACEMGLFGQCSFGQLVRQAYGQKMVSIGFCTYQGRVSAAKTWDGPVLNQPLAPSHADSYEALFHRFGLKAFFLPLRQRLALQQLLVQRIGQRQLGVVYNAAVPFPNGYQHAQLARQFDGVVYCDVTSALKPWDAPCCWQGGDLPATFPEGY